ncbi:hypothetical protein AB0K48_54330 [Nonomuraea sp. NPDC055795]
MKRRLTLDDLWDFAIPSSPALSPDGSRVVYALRTAECEPDRNVRALWVVETAGTAEPRRLTHGPSDGAPAWSPDGSRLAFLREGQLFTLRPDGGEPERLTDLPLGAGAPRWSPDGCRTTRGRQDDGRQ